MVVPGQAFLDPTKDGQRSMAPTYQLGPGVFQRDGKILASTVGYATREGGVSEVGYQITVTKGEANSY